MNSDIGLRLFADTVDRWVVHCGYHPQSRRIALHNRSGSVSCGPPNVAPSLFVSGDDLVDVVKLLVRRMMEEMGEAGDWSFALEESVEGARARREAEAVTAPVDHR